MNIIEHQVAPEEIMAYLDGELSHAAAEAVSAHMQHCAECAGLAGQLRGVSQSLSAWSVREASSSLDRSVSDLAEKIASKAKTAKPVPVMRAGFGNWKVWTLGGAAVAILILVVAALSIRSYDLPKTAVPKAQISAFIETDSDALALAARQQVTDLDSTVHRGGGGGGAPQMPEPPPAPMIARTVSLTILVKDFAASRASLDAILARHQGYSAQLNVSTLENLPRSFQANLRIPATELAAALADLKTLGRVESESQSGEEVTERHADLVARLKNSREEEQRLRAILQQRAGKIEDVLQVEEAIARVRGEIERMDAEQKALEHRVDFATVDLRLTEEYKAQLNSPDSAASTRMHNAFVAGMRNAGGTLLGIVLFFEEYGPALLIWLVILGVPVYLVWRRYRKTRARI